MLPVPYNAVLPLLRMAGIFTYAWPLPLTLEGVRRVQASPPAPPQGSMITGYAGPWASAVADAQRQTQSPQKRSPPPAEVSGLSGVSVGYCGGVGSRGGGNIMFVCLPVTSHSKLLIMLFLPNRKPYIIYSNHRTYMQPYCHSHVLLPKSQHKQEMQPPLTSAMTADTWLARTVPFNLQR